MASVKVKESILPYVDAEDYTSDYIYRSKEATFITYTGSWANDKYHGQGRETYQWLMREFNTVYQKKLHESYRDFSYSISEGTYNQGKLTKGYQAYYDRESLKVEYKDNSSHIVMENLILENSFKQDAYSVTDIFASYTK